MLVTHGHFDHVAGVACLASRGFLVAGHPAAPAWARDFASWARGLGIDAVVDDFSVDVELVDGSRPAASSLELEALHTPGHSPDHMVYVARRERLAFTGDLLFKGSIGRDDIPGGSPEELSSSLRRLVESLEPDYLLLPGHGPETRLEEELRGNQLLRLYIAPGDSLSVSPPY